MAKKIRRQVRSTPTSSIPVSPSLFTGTPARSAEKEFKPDYSNIIRDLKHIGALAGVFFVILIALSFIL